MNHLLTFFADVNWRIVAVVFVGVVAWRREEIAALVTRFWFHRVGGNGHEKAQEAGPDADPVDRLLAELQERRDALVAELEWLDERHVALSRQLNRIEGMFKNDRVSQ